MRRVIITKDCISFAFVKKLEEIDRIPLEGVDYVKSSDELGSKLEIIEDSSSLQYVLQVATNPDGHNSGRSYYLRTNSKETFEEIFPLLSNYARVARERAQASTYFRRAQLRVRSIYQHIICQSIFALIIFGVSFNFTVSKRKNPSLTAT